jgi:hypothetical protein
MNVKSDILPQGKEAVEDRKLRRIFGPTREENWRRIHDEELHNSYPSPDITVVRFGTALRRGDVTVLSHFIPKAELKTQFVGYI